MNGLLPEEGLQRRTKAGEIKISRVQGVIRGCPAYFLGHESGTDAFMEYDNGAGSSTFSNCVGGCIGENPLSACYQGCWNSFSCGYAGDYYGADLTCPYTFVDVVTTTCNNGSTGLVYSASLNCCCAAQMGAECGDYGVVQCNGDCSDGDDDECEGSGDGTIGAACSSDDDCDSGLNCDIDTCTCGGDTDPILIDLTGAGYLMTSLPNGVNFDILADGKRKQLAWTEEGSSVGFLALDKNGNGKIDNGSELFTGLSSPATAGGSRRPAGDSSPTTAGPSMKTAAAGGGAQGGAQKEKAATTGKGGFAALALYDQPEH